MNSYEARQQARRERLEARADRLRAKGESRIAQARERASIIPFGQPILVGHHSEKGDRSYRSKIEAGFRAGFSDLKAAGELAGRAASVGTGGISSDDPDAVDKLRQQLADAEKLQERMRAANAAIRKAKGDQAATVAALASLGFGERIALQLMEPDFVGRIGFADFQLQNNGANVRRIKARIEQLERQAQAVEKETEVKGVRVVENVEANRLQLLFPGKPDDATRALLKSHGFRWSPTEGAWQRHLSNGARYAAECVLRAV